MTRDTITENNPFFITAWVDLDAEVKNMQTPDVWYLVTPYNSKQILPNYRFTPEFFSLYWLNNDVTTKSDCVIMPSSAILPPLNYVRKTWFKNLLPPPHEREVWLFQKADSNLVRWVANKSNLDKTQTNLSINENRSVSTLSENSERKI